MVPLVSGYDFLMELEDGMDENTSGLLGAFRLREFLVEPGLHRITGPGGPVQVGPRVTDVLLVLASEPGQV